jgi:uncharacterized protein (TIGR03435 family)
MNFWQKPKMLVSVIAAASLLGSFGFLCLPKLRAQSQTPAGYEVASIKRSHSIDPRSRGIEFPPGGRFQSTGMPFLMVFGIAYNVPTNSIESMRLRVKGMPDWMLTDLYDIEATPEKGSPQESSPTGRNEGVRRILRSVLADRLKLRVRQDEEEMPVFAIMVGTHGPALQKSKVAEQDCVESAPFSPIPPPGPGCHQFQGGVGRGIRGDAVDMADLALEASSWSELPVVDQTGLTGLYAIQTEGWRSTSNDDETRPTLEDVFDRLGLKLVRRKAAISILVVEHVEKPSEN